MGVHLHFVLLYHCLGIQEFIHVFFRQGPLTQQHFPNGFSFYMLENRNIALSREKLLCEVWGYDFFGDARTLDTHIKLLRKSLGRYSNYIVTLRGVGYRFEEI